MPRKTKEQIQEPQIEPEGAQEEEDSGGSSQAQGACR